MFFIALVTFHATQVSLNEGSCRVSIVDLNLGNNYNGVGDNLIL
jgi:hypothetical protein